MIETNPIQNVSIEQCYSSRDNSSREAFGHLNFFISGKHGNHGYNLGNKSK